MSKSIATEDMIFSICSDFQEKGISPTYDLVRQALGGGSYSTIARGIRKWEAAQAAAREVGRDQLSRAVIDTIRAEVARHVADAKKQWGEDLERSERRREEGEEIIGELEAELETTRGAVKEEGEKARLRVEDAEKARDAAQERECLLLQQIAELKTVAEAAGRNAEALAAANAVTRVGEERTRAAEQRAEDALRNVERLWQEVENLRNAARESEARASEERSRADLFEREAHDLRRKIEGLTAALANREQSSPTSREEPVVQTDLAVASVPPDAPDSTSPAETTSADAVPLPSATLERRRPGRPRKTETGSP